MGCFNMKCALTQLPVRAGDEVVMLIGVKPDNMSGYLTHGFLYQPTFFKLLTTPVFGFYNEYGWIDDIDEVTLKAARRLLKIQDLGGAAKALTGDHWNDNLDAMSRALDKRAGKGRLLTRRASYSFVHRSAWDNLLEYGRQHTISLHVNNVSKEDAQYLKATMKGLGFSKEQLDKYGERKVYSAKATTVDFFNAALRETPALLEKTDFSRGPSSITGSLGRVLAWFELLFPVDPMYGFSDRENDAMKLVFQVASEKPDLREMLEQTHVIYQALVENQLVIRASDDIASQSQDTTYWGHIAVVKAAAGIIHHRAVMGSTDANELSGIAAVEHLATHELKTIY